MLNSCSHRKPLETLSSPKFELPLSMLRRDHEWIRLAESINWVTLADSFGPLYSKKMGRPGIPIRTMTGLVMLQHTFGLSDEQAVVEWPERPYWQFLCGDEFFRHELPVDFSQILRRRKWIGKQGVERILKLTVEVDLSTKILTKKQMQVVVVDRTVQSTAAEYPTDAGLFRKVLHHLLRVADETGTKLRQSHRDLAKSAFLMHGRYRRAKQFNRATGERRKLKTYAGRVQRDLERKLSDEVWERHMGTMSLAELQLAQEKDTKGKVYSMHAPEAECIAKGKAHKRYQLGVKTSLATTAWGGFALGTMSLSGNLFDGHMLDEQLGQVHWLTGRMPKRCHVDRGYKSHSLAAVTCRVIVAGSRRGITKAMKQEMKRRSAIEPEIGHQKPDGNQGRNWLKGVLGGDQNAVLCAAGHNLRKILAHLGASFCPHLGPAPGRVQPPYREPIRSKPVLHEPLRGFFKKDSRRRFL